ncbi:MAG: GFA family protein [Gammaproteobacteria bacterium]|jgi:hypothetical protein
MSNELHGSCLCGAVSYEATGDSVFQGFCQCLDCRKATGSGHLAAIGMPEQTVTVTGETKSFSKPADSGGIVSRHFCPECGSLMFDKSTGMPGLVVLNVAVLDDPEVFKPESIVFTRHALSWDKLDPDLPRFEGMPPME